jgi:hypothetical protein
MDRTKNLSIMVHILVRAMDRTKNLSIMAHILVRAMDRTTVVTLVKKNGIKGIILESIRNVHNHMI